MSSQEQIEDTPSDPLVAAEVNDDKFWFSHWTHEYEVKETGPMKKEFFLLKNKPQIKMDWDNCTINIATALGDGKIRLVVRSKTDRNSDYMGDKPVQIRFMLGIDVSPDSISEVRAEPYKIARDSKRKDLNSLKEEEERERWVFNLGKEAEVWQWANNNQDMRSSKVFALRERIRKFLDLPEEPSGGKIFRVKVEQLDKVIPVIYQPAVDSLDNFLRDVHCHIKNEQDSDNVVDVEVTLVFNNEYLRRFWILDHSYKWFRKIKYGRMLDIETFHIHFVKDKLNENYFLFEGIYSGSHDLQQDATHFDVGKRVEHEIAYYLADQFHPIVFVNTSNHAMSEHDNNHGLWKWEYIPWIKKAPIKLGNKSRKQIDAEYLTIFDRFIRLLSKLGN
ncbi:MAG: hypothetical protein HRF40_06780 [Nitrososphaera sp.]